MIQRFSIPCFFLLVLLSQSLSAQPFLTRNYHVSGPGNERIKDLYLDGGGNRFVTGLFTDTLNILGDGSLELFAGGKKDGFLARYSRDGDLTWLRQLQSAGDVVPQTMSVDQLGMLWIAGYYEDTLRALSPSGATLTEVITTTGQPELFVARYTPAGNLIFLKSIAGSFPGQRNMGISLDRDTAYLCSSFSRLDHDDDTATSWIEVPEEAHAFLMKLSPDGTGQWTRTFGPDSADLGTFKTLALDVEADGFGRIYVGGAFRGSVDFDPGPDSTRIVSSSNVRDDAYLTIWNRKGELGWVRVMGANRVRSIESAPGTVFVAGLFEDTAWIQEDSGLVNYVSTGGDDLFAVRFSSEGDWIWTYTAGSTANDFVSDLVVSTDENLYATGGLNNGALLGALETATGSEIFAYSILQGDSIGNSSEADCIAMDATGEVVLGAFYRDIVDLDPGEDTLTLPYSQRRDLVVAAFHPRCNPYVVPDSLSAEVNFGPGGQVVLNWSPVQGSVGCKAEGRELGTSDPFQGYQVAGYELGELNFPTLQLEADKTYEWRVACACNGMPVYATPYSALDTFNTDTTGVLRIAEEELQTDLFRLAEGGWLFRVGEPVQYSLYDLHGRLLESGRIETELILETASRIRILTIQPDYGTVHSVKVPTF